MNKRTSTKLHELRHALVSNCGFQELPDQSKFASDFDDGMDLRPALLQFMVAATPSDDVVNSILGNFDSHVAKMMVTPTSHFASQGSPDFLVNSVPDAINPVKAKLAYVQAPDVEGNMHLVLVWKVCLVLVPRIPAVLI
jgi:extracellular elastinolytic metalloproteinase